MSEHAYLDQRHIWAMPSGEDEDSVSAVAAEPVLEPFVDVIPRAAGESVDAYIAALALGGEKRRERG